jgi:hypothetical protein
MSDGVKVDEERAARKIRRDLVIRYINAQGSHMSESWKDAFVEAFDLEVDRGNPYEPVRAKEGGPAIDEAR